jgi:hypothetical protein
MNNCHYLGIRASTLPVKWVKRFTVIRAYDGLPSFVCSLVFIVLEEGLGDLLNLYLDLEDTGLTFNLLSYPEVYLSLVPIKGSSEHPVFKHAIKVYSDPLNQRAQMREEK